MLEKEKELCLNENTLPIDDIADDKTGNDKTGNDQDHTADNKAGSNDKL